MLTVLIVDDEPHIVELVRVTLEDDRVRVFEAPDGETALSQAVSADPDLILLDVNLPDMSGLEVCRQLRQALEYTGRIVILTAAAQHDEMSRGLAAGADRYVTKPFSPVRLLGLVEEMVPQAALWTWGPQRDSRPQPTPRGSGSPACQAQIQAAAS
jgi:two-component system OmpR family response regulator